MKTLLVFCPNLVGDTVMAIPSFRALRIGFPAARIVGIVKPKVAPTLDGGPWFDALVGFDPRSPRLEDRGKSVLKTLRREAADAAVLFPNSLRSAWMAWRSGAARRIGYDRGGRSWLLTDRITPPRDDRGRFLPTPILDYYREIPKAMGCPDVGPEIDLYTTRDDEDAADRAWTTLAIPRDRPVVCLNTGGAFGPAKSWPEGHFARLAQRLVDEAGVSVLIVCGPQERESARSIAVLAARRGVVSLADQPLSIGLSKASIRRSKLLITTDSGPRHFATGFDIPVITLYGPTEIRWTLSHHSKALHLHHPVPCAPCQRPTCREVHHRCLRDLSPDAVFRSALDRLRFPIRSVDQIDAV